MRTLIAFAGDNPDREGLVETPKRVVGAYEELYRGYRECPADILERTFSEIDRYDDFVLVRDIARKLAATDTLPNWSSVARSSAVASRWISESATSPEKPLSAWTSIA